MKTLDEMLETYTQLPTGTICAHCGERVHLGPVKEGREALAQHRAEVHPELGSFEAACVASRRKHRVTNGKKPWTARRENASQADLDEREFLRRERRPDAPAGRLG